MAMLVRPWHDNLHGVLTVDFPKVFAESWQLRSRLKADVRVQVRNLKTLFPDDTTNATNDFEGQRTTIRNTISKWIADGSYLHDTVPDSVSGLDFISLTVLIPFQDAQVHFGHPIIASACRSFYFDKWSEIATFDRDTFHGSVPKPLVALIGTIVSQINPFVLQAF